MVKKLLIPILFFTLPNLFAQTISVGASTDTTDYLVGDYINYEIEIVAKNNVRVFPPSIADSLKKVELISAGKPVITQNDNSKTILYPFILAGYDSAEVTVPEIPIEYKLAGDSTLRKITTEPVSFSVHTLPVKPNEDIKDVKDPLKIPFDWKWFLLWVLIGLIVLAAAYFLYKKYKMKKLEQVPGKKIIKIPAHVRAFAALDELENEQLWQKGNIKEYHSRLTEIVRAYFEERFNLPALELTTTEAMQRLRNVDDARDIIEITYNFLTNADLVKFAKFKPMDSVNEEMMQQAREIIQRTIPEEKVTFQPEEVNV